MTLNDEDRVSNMNPVFCVLDRRERDDTNRKLYTDAQQRYGLRIKEAAYIAYGVRPQVYLNFNEGFMTVKVAKPKPSEKNRNDVATFNSWCMSQGIQMKVLRGNILYHFN